MVHEFLDMKKFGFNPDKDLHVVDTPMAGVDLRSAYAHGVVPAGVVGSDLEFNDVEDPSSLMNHPQDQFEAMRQSDHVKCALKSRAEAEPKAATEGE